MLLSIYKLYLYNQKQIVIPPVILSHGAEVDKIRSLLCLTRGQVLYVFNVVQHEPASKWGLCQRGSQERSSTLVSCCFWEAPPAGDGTPLDLEGNKWKSESPASTVRAKSQKQKSAWYSLLYEKMKWKKCSLIIIFRKKKVYEIGIISELFKTHFNMQMACSC